MRESTFSFAELSVGLACNLLGMPLLPILSITLL